MLLLNIYISFWVLFVLLSHLQGDLPGSDHLCGLKFGSMKCFKVRAQSMRLQVLLTIQHLFSLNLTVCDGPNHLCCLHSCVRVSLSTLVKIGQIEDSPLPLLY